MKKAVFLIALSILLRPVFPVVTYVIDYDYIATVLCVNKDKPELECNGKCHLMQELAKASDSEKPASTDKKSHLETIDWIPAETAITVQTPVFIKSASNESVYQNGYSALKLVSIFHPPAFIS